MKHSKRTLITLLSEILLTVFVFSAVAVNSVRVIHDEVRQYAEELSVDYTGLTERYLSVFRAMMIPVGEKLAENPSFGEMNAWLQAHDEAFGEAVGKDVFDGFAMTYQGGYAHSWDYGDYSDYDPDTRLWYQQAQKAGGEAVVVAPYVSYLGQDVLAEDQLIELSVVQRVSDGVSCELDLKLAGIAGLFSQHTLDYRQTQCLLYNPEGYILSASDSVYYAHNVAKPDGVVSESLSALLAEAQSDRLRLCRPDGRLCFLYTMTDGQNNTYCVMVPFRQFFSRDLQLFALILVLLTLLELNIYMRNRRVVAELSARDERVTQIARAAFERQFYVDLATFRIDSDADTHGMTGTNDYRAIYDKLLRDLADPAEARAFEDFLAPDSLAARKGAGLCSRSFSFDLPVKDGGKLRRILEFSCLVSDFGGRPTAVLLANDVTERAEEERRIMLSLAHHYSAVYAGSADGPGLRAIKTAPGYDEILRAPSVAERESRCRALVMPVFVPQLLALCAPENIAAGLADAGSCALTLQRLDGRWDTVRIIRSERYKQNRDWILFIESADEQMQHQAELREALARAQEATNAKTDFLSRMSHDIRTPMNGIIGMTRIAQQQPNPPATADCLQKIAFSSDYMLGLLNDILDMTKIESGEVRLSPEPYPFSEFRRYLDSVIRPLCQAKHQTLTLCVSADETCVPLFDKLRINQILFNLLSNAVKYTPEGGQIEFRSDGEERGGRLALTFCVRDSGIGMSEAFQKVLFEPFTQEPRAHTGDRAVSSTGLGLAIVKKLVELMGGEITVESRVNAGSAFTVRLSTDFVR